MNGSSSDLDGYSQWVGTGNLSQILFLLGITLLFITILPDMFWSQTAIERNNLRTIVGTSIHTLAW